jgi:hypothetical protein
MNSIAYRIAVPADTTQILDIACFWNKKWIENDFEKGFLVSIFSQADMLAIISAETAVVAVSEDATVVGYGIVNTVIENNIRTHCSNWMNRFADPSLKSAYMSQIIVKDGFFRKGINQKILSFFRQEMKNKIDLFYGIVYRQNQHALNVHLNSGWTIVDEDERGYLISISS